jgi:hypothetical protein
MRRRHSILEHGQVPAVRPWSSNPALTRNESEHRQGLVLRAQPPEHCERLSLGQREGGISCRGRSRPDHQSDLVHILGTIGAVGQMLLETPLLAGREAVLQVLGGKGRQFPAAHRLVEDSENAHL